MTESGFGRTYDDEGNCNNFNKKGKPIDNAQRVFVYC